MTGFGMTQVQFILLKLEMGQIDVTKTVIELKALPMDEDVILEQCRFYLNQQVQPYVFRLSSDPKK